MANADVYAKVFGGIVEAMKQGQTPWVRPWQGGASLPFNAVTGRHYSGGNVLALWFRAASEAWTSAAFVTYKQAQAAGCVVRKGEKGTAVYFMSRADKKDEQDEKVGTYFFARQFVVFNVAQLDEVETGALAKLVPTPEPRAEIESITAADVMVSATGAAIAHNPVDARAYYAPSIDLINMPPRRFFDSTAGYYGTLFHELTHWTGAEKRLNRVQSTKFGKPEYAFEELGAELGAAFLSAFVGLDVVTQSAAYLSSWVRACEDHPEVLARAASLAQAAAAYVQGGAIVGGNTAANLAGAGAGTDSAPEGAGA